MQELVYFFLISFLITISTIGYGLLIIKLAKYKFEETNFCEILFSIERNFF